MGKTIQKLGSGLVTFTIEQPQRKMVKVIDWVYKLFTKKTRIHYRTESYTKLINSLGKVEYVHQNIICRNLESLTSKLQEHYD